MACDRCRDLNINFRAMPKGWMDAHTDEGPEVARRLFGPCPTCSPPIEAATGKEAVKLAKQRRTEEQKGSK